MLSKPAGSYGQLLAPLLFVYAGLALSGATVPVQALPGLLRTLSDIEPLRQVLAGTRSIIYFGAQGDAGLTRGTLAAAPGLLFWLATGSAIVQWYDRRRLYRLHPDLLAAGNHGPLGKKKEQLSRRRTIARGNATTAVIAFPSAVGSDGLA